MIRSDGMIDDSKLSEVDGVLSLAQAEFRRRVVVPYEDSKIQQNGDVYEGLLHRSFLGQR